MKQFILPEDLGTAILHYLGTKPLPWIETNELIAGLQNLTEANIPSRIQDKSDKEQPRKKPPQTKK